ncbi:PREDICTED: Sterile alpha motif [Prunus dulcis]|uniref:PREDICTED: Sterile alpha motif n=1 Tax=Prunus dulcis TaxID=3755 RepID=A0A5E4EL09_PRUDU|nr:uncharacterized protein LOC117636175 [Prunus dulcis]KAI5318765.1 hypothetical protein L3X38_038473 [Prunus dulcis]VVA15311.1 PREDICTED: Sterile alpha motif [Prunus dulcis]
MAKKRQRQLVVALHKNNTPSGLIESSNSDNDLDLQDSWVIVKKQRVKILIPPLPVINKSPPPNPGPIQLQPVATEVAGDGSQLPVETCPKTASIHERKKIESLAPKRGIQLTRKRPPAKHVSTFSKSYGQDLRMELRNQDQFVSSQCHRTLGVSKTSKAILQPRRSHGPSIFLDQGMLLNQRLRALNLERKLQKAGGLSQWLASLGLGQFVRIFQRKGLSKFQLVNLTMKKLKDMGANAVGPRRKLMHAIDCFCQPCFY